jgi:hypothetical protein
VEKGFGVIEMVVALTVGLSLLAMVVSSAAESGRVTRRMGRAQDRLESIFVTVDTIKSDLGKCGQRLQEAARDFGFFPFRMVGSGFLLFYGTGSEPLTEDAAGDDSSIRIAATALFPSGRTLLLYNSDLQACQWNEAAGTRNGKLLLRDKLKSGFPAGSEVVAVRQVEYRWDNQARILRRRIDGGGFQPLLEEVSDFYVAYFADSQSVLYRIEVDKKEQVRGYLFLANLVTP